MEASETLRAEDLQVGEVRLRLWHLDHADSSRPRVVLLHGMRDVGRSLLPVAQALTGQFNVTLLDQRGHGASDYPGAYSMEHFYYDLHQVIAHLNSADRESVALIGHSLGGQICARFAGLFPELVHSLVLIEGLGPPEPQWPRPATTAPLDIASYRALLLDRMALPARTRALPNLEFAAGRLQLNNPRMSSQQAGRVARVATRSLPAGADDSALHWAFDPRVASAFVGFSLAESERLWQAVNCPVLTITGAHAHEYWRTAVPYPDYSGHFQDGEYQARIAHFGNIEHQQFDGSGHMVHFDEPERLAECARKFLESHI
ncbi:MAG: alpha/beta fold hydrolase [Pseudomonadales bacterium]